MSNEMMREDVLGLYRPIRQAILRITGLATKTCSRTDMMRAAKQLGLWTAQGLPAIQDEASIDMMCDVALFEPNQRGRLAFDTFYQEHGQHLDPFDRALAASMTGARFSLFRAAGKHEVAGVWLEDLLDGNRRLWVMDESMETSLAPDRILGMRLFDAGPFHVGFGIVILPDEETIHMSVASQERSGRQPFRYSLVATLYSDKLSSERPLDPKQEWIIETLLASLGAGTADRTAPRARAVHKQKPRPKRPL